jgi:hypothetical protein
VRESAVMRVPKATMHEDNSQTGCENKVWFAGQIFSMQPVAIAQFMSKTTHCQLGKHVLAADGAHILAAVHLS